MGCVHIEQTNWVWCVDLNEYFRKLIWPCGQRSRSHIIKTFKIARNTYIFFIYFERGCSYSPQCVHIICRLQQTSQNIFMTLKLRVKVKYFLKSVLRLITQTPHSCIDGVLSYLAQWLIMKCSLKRRFHIVHVTLKSTPRSHLLKTYIQNILWAPLSFLELEGSYLAEWLPMVCCLFDLIPFIPVNIFSVKSCQDGSYWVELSLSRM